VGKYFVKLKLKWKETLKMEEEWVQGGTECKVAYGSGVQYGGGTQEVAPK
jgi:hypothetical protein